MSTEDNDVPSVVILFGPNGIGKTTLLQMLDGFMRLDFDAFRRVPFGRAHLKFSNGKILYVKRLDDGTLRVSFGNHSVVLSGERKGAADESDAAGCPLPQVVRVRFEDELGQLGASSSTAALRYRDGWLSGSSPRRR